MSFTNPLDPSNADTTAGLHYAYATSQAALATTYAGATDGTSKQFTFDDGPGDYIVYGRIFDKDGGFTEYNTTVHANNVAPTAGLSNNGPVNEASPAMVNFTNPFDPSNTDTSTGFHYTYATSQAALATTYAGATDGTSKQFTFDDGPGDFVVYGRIFDKDGGFTEYHTAVHVNNVAPTAAIGNNGPVNEGSSSTVNFINPLDPSNADTTAGFHYSYATSQASLATTYAGAIDGTNKQFTFDDGPGDYLVYGRIFDKDGGVTEYSTTVHVNNVAPTASLSNNGPVNEASPATVGFANPLDPSNADTTAGFHYTYATSQAALATTYAGATDGTSKQFTFDDGSGDYVVYGRIFDKDGGFTEYSTTVHVNNVAPTASLSNNGPVNEASPATVSFANPLDPSNADTTAGFHYTYATSQAALASTYAGATDGTNKQFTFDDGPGDYVVYGRIFDKDGGFTEYNTTVHVNNVAPTASLSNNGPVNAGSPATVSFANPLDPSTADTTAGFHYSYATSQAALASTYATATDGTSKQFTFGAGGSYTVFGRVFDKDNGFTEYSTTVLVNATGPVFSNVSITPNINENGFVVLGGDITDPTPLATLTLTIDWGNGPQQIISFAGGTANFLIQHQYLDDNPTGTASDTYTVNLTVVNNLNQTAVTAKQFTVNNLPPGDRQPFDHFASQHQCDRTFDRLLS